jgi:hypothetical protein
MSDPDQQGSNGWGQMLGSTPPFGETDTQRWAREQAERIASLETALAEEREKNERLRTLLAEAVEWARRPSPIPIRPFNDFIDRAALASTGSEEPFDPAVYEELSRQRTKFDHQP